MPSSGRPTVQSRLDRGYGQECAHSHHGQCHAAVCACDCHTGGKKPTPAQAPRAETEPKRPELKGPKAPVSAAAAKQLKSQLALALWGADQGAARLWPKYWTTPDDRLADDERTLLVDATYAELAARFPDLVVWLAKASESATEAMLLYAIAVVAAPRLARHGVIPNDLASAIVFAPILIASAQQQADQGATQDSGSAAGVEPIGTPVADWSNGYGQVHVGGVPVGAAQVQGGPQIETRSGDVSSAADYQNGRGNGQHPV